MFKKVLTEFKRIDAISRCEDGPRARVSAGGVVVSVTRSHHETPLSHAYPHVPSFPTATQRACSN